MRVMRQVPRTWQRYVAATPFQSESFSSAAAPNRAHRINTNTPPTTAAMLQPLFRYVPLPRRKWIPRPEHGHPRQEMQTRSKRQASDQCGRGRFSYPCTCGDMRRTEFLMSRLPWVTRTPALALPTKCSHAALVLRRSRPVANEALSPRAAPVSNARRRSEHSLSNQPTTFVVLALTTTMAGLWNDDVFRFQCASKHSSSSYHPNWRIISGVEILGEVIFLPPDR